MSSTRVTNPWVLMRTVNPDARLNLICFPYAGGGAQLFNSWQAAFAQIQICAVQYPGRGSRVREEPFTDCRALVQALVPNLLPFLNKPFAFFGHSMGAIIAYEVARHVQEQHGLKLERLIASGRRAPQLSSTEPLTYNLPEAEFIDELRRLNGTPQEVLNHPELMQLMLGIIRADFQLTQTYEFAPGPQLSCPFSVFGGLEDDAIPREHLEAWCELTSSGCSVKMLEGDHFFLLSNEKALWRAINGVLVRDL
jgi:surfactin synthase thioesterase subunit